MRIVQVLTSQISGILIIIKLQMIGTLVIQKDIISGSKMYQSFMK
jgi:hypothetical protein